MPLFLSAAVSALGVLASVVYLRRGRTQAHPLIDFSILRFRSYRTTVIGGLPLRVAIGATPFLLPLLFQLGFGMSPLHAGVLTVATAVGSLSTRGAVTLVVRRFGYRRLLVACAALTTVFYAMYAMFTSSTPDAVIGLVLLLAGISNAMTLVILAAIGYREIPRNRMAHATALATMGQQLSVTLGVATAASLVELTHYLRGAAGLVPEDFRPAFVVIALLPLVSACAFWRLPREGEMEGDLRRT